MTDNTARGSFLCVAISVLAERDIQLVITSNPGEAYHFEMDGRRVTESDVIVRAAMLDPSVLSAFEDGVPDRGDGGTTVTAFRTTTRRRERVRRRERSSRQSAR